MRLHHVGWVARDLARTRMRFLREGACEVTGPIQDPIQRVTVQFLSEPGSEILWELVAPLAGSETSPVLARLKRGGGLDHVCYELCDAGETIEGAVVNERENGSILVVDPVFAAAFGRRIAFVVRPSGRLVEYVERRPTGAVV